MEYTTDQCRIGLSFHHKAARMHEAKQAEHFANEQDALAEQAQQSAIEHWRKRRLWLTRYTDALVAKQAKS